MRRMAVSGSQKLRILVGGLVGQYPLGGVAWDYFHYLTGLAELGHDVVYHEDTWVWPHDPIKGYPVDSPDYTTGFIRGFFERYAPSLVDKWCYVLLHDKHFGMSKESFDDFARSCDVYLNVSGACFLPDALNPRAKRVFLDTDPGYNQIVLATKPAWSENVDRWVHTVTREHDVHLTYAENIWASDCALPRCGLDWRPTRCVVTLPHWKDIADAAPPANAPLTTVMTWNYFKGAVEHDGVCYDSKVREFEKFKDLPRRTKSPLLMAIAGEKYDPDDLRQHGWTWMKGIDASSTPEVYRDFIRNSSGEWSIAKNVYVQPRTGWFSCRTACYLAAGRPAVVQDTAWSRYVRPGDGLFAFNTMDECLAGLDAIRADPERHRRGAYEIAREYLAPDRVLTPMLEAIFAKDRTMAPLPFTPLATGN